MLTTDETLADVPQGAEQKTTVIPVDGTDIHTRDTTGERTRLFEEMQAGSTPEDQLCDKPNTTLANQLPLDDEGNRKVLTARGRKAIDEYNDLVDAVLNGTAVTIPKHQVGRLQRTLTKFAKETMMESKELALKEQQLIKAQHDAAIRKAKIEALEAKVASVMAQYGVPPIPGTNFTPLDAIDDQAKSPASKEELPAANLE